jgi:hypothetical protein
VEIRWPAGRRLAVLGLGGITAKAQAAAAARNNAVKAEAAKQQAAAAKQPQQKDDTKGGDVVCVLTPGHTYRLDVGMEWEGWIYRQNEDGKKEEAGHLTGQTTYLPKGADPNNPPGTARSFFFRTTPKPSASDTTAAVAALPIYGQKDFVKALRVQRNLFRPEMLSRYLLGYSPAQTEAARFGDDPVDAHFAAAHVTTLASVYGFDLTLDLRRVDVPGNEGLPVTLTPNWVALKEPKLLTGLDARRIEVASTAACPMPKPGATLTGKPLAPLEREAWYEVYALAKSKDPTNVLDGRLDGVTFRTSRWRNPAEMIDGLGFKSSPAGE